MESPSEKLKATKLKGQARASNHTYWVQMFYDGLPHTRYYSSWCWEPALNRTGKCLLDLRGYTLIGGPNTLKLHHEHHEWKQSMMEPGECLYVCGDSFTLRAYRDHWEGDVEKNPKWKDAVSHFSIWGKCSSHEKQRPQEQTGLLNSRVGKTTIDTRNTWKRSRQQ